MIRTSAARNFQHSLFTAAMPSPSPPTLVAVGARVRPTDAAPFFAMSSILTPPVLWGAPVALEPEEARSAARTLRARGEATELAAWLEAWTEAGARFAWA